MAKIEGCCAPGDVTEVRSRDDGRTAYGEFFPRRLSASTLLQVSALYHPDQHRESEAIAVL